MLKVLRRIVQEVNSAEDLQHALNIIVQRSREVMNTQACSIFLIDNKTDEYVLMATEGLNIEAVGQVRFPLDKGVIGFVGKRGEPINLDDASTHPKFHYVPEVKEDNYRAFLGVPIIHQRRLLGVLIVQQEEPRRFDESEEAFLVTLAVQLAGILAHAEAIGTISGLMANTDVYNSLTLVGMPSSPGVGIGTVVVSYPLADLDAVPDRKAQDVASEIALFENALEMTKEDISKLSKQMSESLPLEERALFDAYLRILDSEGFATEVIEEIRKGRWAQSALRQVIKQHVSHFDAMDDEYLRERAADIKDLGRRVLSHLQANERSQPTYPHQTILVGEEITAADLAGAPEGRLFGVVSAKGSANSHAAILARALGIPTVMGINGMPVDKLEGREIIVDGYHGQVYVSPSPSLRQEFIRLAEEESELDAGLQELRDLPSQTQDGHTMPLCVNAGLVADVGYALRVGADGVGLYRTEVPFMAKERFPSEKEQFVIYQQLLNAFAPRPVIMRTLDVGGDKELSYFPVKEDNPFMGWRGIRITLDHPELFLVQVRAMLRANAALGNLRIMLPMISGTREVDDALELFAQAHAEVVEEGTDVEMPPLGVMIEVPSAVYQARALAKRVDFLSVGTNDLTQYMLAVDRSNARVARLYDSLHPAVIHALHYVVKNAHKEGIKANVCGEMASDPMAVILLLAMEFDSISMTASSILRMKWVIRKFTLKRAKELLEEVLTMDNPVQIRERLKQVIDEAGLGGLIRAGKI